MALAIADATNTEIALPRPPLPAQCRPRPPENIIERYERIEEHQRTTQTVPTSELSNAAFTPPPDTLVPDRWRSAATVNDQAAGISPPSSNGQSTGHANAAPVDMTGDDVNITALQYRRPPSSAARSATADRQMTADTAYWNRRPTGCASPSTRRARGATWSRTTGPSAVRPAYAAAQRRQLAGPASRITHHAKQPEPTNDHHIPTAHRDPPSTAPRRLRHRRWHPPWLDRRRWHLLHCLRPAHRPQPAHRRQERRSPELRRAHQRPPRPPHPVRLRRLPSPSKCPTWRPSCSTGAPPPCAGLLHHARRPQLQRPACRRSLVRLDDQPHTLIAGTTGSGKARWSACYPSPWPSTRAGRARHGPRRHENSDLASLAALPHVNHLPSSTTTPLPPCAVSRLNCAAARAPDQHPKLLSPSTNCASFRPPARHRRPPLLYPSLGCSSASTSSPPPNTPKPATSAASSANFPPPRRPGRRRPPGRAAADRPGTGAERLPGNGAFLAISGPDTLRIQAYWIDDSAVASLVRTITAKMACTGAHRCTAHFPARTARKPDPHR